MLKNRRLLTAFVLFWSFIVSFNLHAAPAFNGKKVLYIDSYHAEMVWIEGITGGIQSVFNDTGVELKVIHMDTKRHGEEAEIQQAALAAKAEIEQFKPDVVIVSDDNAVKYLLMPYYKDADLPFVFCGVNAELSTYEMPYKNTTGMLEVSLAKSIVNLMQSYAKGKVLGSLAIDRFSQKETIRYHEETLGLKYDPSQIYYVNTFDEWKQQYLKLQDSADMVFIQSSGGIENWDDAAAIEFVKNNTKIPSGTERRSMKDFSMLAIAIVPEEHGRWAAEAALKILQGTSPADIPVAENKEGQLIINLPVAMNAGVMFDPALLETAEIVH